MVGDEGQEHQRVLQPFGFVDGDHLDQIRVALQAQFVAVAVAFRVGNGIKQKANQRVFAVQLGAGLLQQLAQVQQVGEQALTLFKLRQQASGNIEIHHHAAHQRQHALALPQAVVVAELLYPLFPGQLVLLQVVQLRQA